jgi:hypothetical protein
MANVADVLFVHNGVMKNHHLPKSCRTGRNLRFINMESTYNLMELVVRRLLDHLDDDKQWEIPPQQFIQFLAQQTDQYPYTLVEYKPAWGHILADYLPNQPGMAADRSSSSSSSTIYYSHWAYSDLDVLWGDLGRHLSWDDWTDFDIVTWGYGDQRRLYLRGQFTMHRNDPVRINKLWQSCEYLYRIDRRYANMVKEEQEFHLESAEGCYSVAVLRDHNLAVKYASVAWTDVDNTDTASRSGVYLIRDVAKQQHLLIKRAEEDDHTAGVPAIGSYNSLTGSPLYREEDMPWHEPIGAIEPVTLPSSYSDSAVNIKDDPCNFFWIQPIYRHALCLKEEIQPDETLYWIRGELHKQQVVPMVVQTGLETGPLFHFQEWKRHYQTNHLTAISDPSWSALVLTREGGIPVQYQETTVSGIRRRFAEDHAVASPLSWKGPWENIMEKSESRLQILSDLGYCLRFTISNHQLVCDDMIHWADVDRIKILTRAPAWKDVDAGTEVTLCLAVAITDMTKVESLTGIIGSNLENWQDEPAVVVISLPPGGEDHVNEALDQISNALVSFDETAFVAVVLSQPVETDDDAETAPQVVPNRNALFNMAVDMSPTRWFVSGLEVERGLILNRNSVILALRAVATSVRSGRALWLAQHALEGEHAIGLQASSASVRELSLAKTQSAVQPAWQLGQPCGENDGDNSVLALDTLWWSLSNVLLDSDKSTSISRAEIAFRAKRIDEISQEILRKPDVETTESPIILMDNAGPIPGARAHTLLREPESMYGVGCMGRLRLALLLAAGYQLDVLEGAFAVSTSETRIQTLDCEGCIAWKGHQKKKEELRQIEIRRVVDSAIVWENPQKHT